MSNAIQYVERNRIQDGGGINDFSVERYAQVARHISPDARIILDVGCNNGVGAAPLRHRAPAAKLIGLDCVPERLSEAAKVFDETVEGFASRLPLNDRSACAVVACEVVEHLTRSDAELFLAEASRVLHAGGRIVLTTPNPRYIKLYCTGRKVTDDVAHLSAYSMSTLKKMLVRNGFDIVRAEGTGRVSRHIGARVPLPFIYGSYLLVGSRSSK